MHVSQYLAGTQFPAGLGRSTILPDMDYETYSEAGFFFDEARQKWHGPSDAAGAKKGLPVIGAANYATHPSTEVLKLAYNLKDGTGPKRWQPGRPPPYDLIEHVRSGQLIEAWNSSFEWWIWNYVCVPKYGWPPLSYLQVRCAQAKARAHCYPGKLDLAGPVMGLTVHKDKRGAALLKKYSMPRDPTKPDPSRRWALLPGTPDDTAMTEYNDTDIVVEAEASHKCPDLEGEELEFWLADQLINRRGVAVDTAALQDCAAIVRQCLETFNAELRELTGGIVQKASELPALKAWLGTRGIHMGDGKGAMDEEAIEAAIKKIDAWLVLAPGEPMALQARRALELRQLVGSASVKKVFAMINTQSPWGRLHDLFNYHGARTGRPTGEGPQPTNLPKAGPKVYRCLCGRHSGEAHKLSCPWCGLAVPPGKKLAEWGPEAVDDALEVMKPRSLALVRHVFGDALLTVSGCLRGLFVAAEGKDLICSDFSSIEGVVTAALAGEDWRMEMFATHGKAYELSVSKITGTPFAEIMAHAGYDTALPEWWLDVNRKHKGPHHPQRQTIGKVAELASGFGGWIGAWKRFGADEFMTDDEIKTAILAWRDASPAIVEFWGGQERGDWGRKYPELFGLEGMAVSAVLNPGVAYPVRRKDGSHTGVTYLMHGDALYCQIPSGRLLTYHRPRLQANTRGWGGQYSFTYEGYNTNSQMGAVGWVTMSAYGGKFCENVVQATARDIQRFAIINLERAGYHVVLHIYDENCCEVPHGFGSVEEMEDIMARMPPWATYQGAPWPIRVSGGWRGLRYRKA